MANLFGIYTKSNITDINDCLFVHVLGVFTHSNITGISGSALPNVFDIFANSSQKDIAALVPVFGIFAVET